MEKHINMDNKLKDIIVDYKSSSNKDLIYALDSLSTDFENTKEMIIKLTHHLDSTENIYNKILSEYNNRNKK